MATETPRRSPSARAQIHGRLEALQGALVVAEVAVRRAEHRGGQRHPLGEAERLEDRHGRLGVADGSRVVAVLGSQHR